MWGLYGDTSAERIGIKSGAGVLCWQSKDRVVYNKDRARGVL